MDFGQFLWTMLLFVMSLLVLELLSKLRQIVQGQKLPPGPRKLPLLGNIHHLIGGMPHLSLQKLSNEYGPLMLLQLGSIPTLVVSSADVAGEIFRNHDLNFSGRPELYSAKRLSYELSDIAFAPYGEYWREIRKIAIFELLSVKKVNSFHSVRDDEVEVMIVSIVRCTRKPVNLSELTLSLANNVICRVAFGKKDDDGTVGNKKAKFHDILHETQTLLGELNVADFYLYFGWLLNKVNGVDERLEKTCRELDKFYNEVIEEHVGEARNRQDHEDLVDVLLRLQKDPNQSITLSNDQMKGILTDMFIAGTDTSSATLVWIMAELIKNPSTMKRAQDEMRQVAKGKHRVEESDLPKLAYLKLVIKETLRLHPPVPLLVPRETIQSCIVRGYEIPAKTRVFINAKAIGMDSNVWGMDSNKFHPERFLNSSIDYKGHDFEFIPFGAGRRGCPGLNFAVLLIELALANLLYCFDWTLPDGMTTNDVDMAEAVGLTMHKKDPLLLSAIPW